MPHKLRRVFCLLTAGFFALAIGVLPGFAGVIYQDFESGNGSDTYGWGINGAGAGFAAGAGGGFVKSGYPSTQCGPETIVGEPVHAGARSWKSSSTWNWGGTAVEPQTSSQDVDLKPEENDRLIFWTLAVPQRACYVYGWSGPTDNNVGVRFFDNGNYAAAGYEVWTTQTAPYAQWRKLSVLFSQLPPDFDLHHVVKIEFVNYSPGTYYFDDVMAVRGDHLYQSFEPGLRSGSTVGEYGWKWNDADTVAFASGGEPVHEGSSSWKLISTQKWGGTGIQSQEKRYLATEQGSEQSFWNVDLNPSLNDRLTFWVYALSENGLDNNVAVQFYDHGGHATDDTKAVVWTKRSASHGRWTKLTVRFSELPPTLNLRDINKIQFQFYWPGTYYIDDIRAAGPQPEIDRSGLSQGILSWSAVSGVSAYRVQESAAGPDGPWQTVYLGAGTETKMRRLAKAWYRIRWEDGVSTNNPAMYASDWSDVVEYAPAAVVINRGFLDSGILRWKQIPQTTLYEAQSAPSKTGPWQTIYKGMAPVEDLAASSGMWYRVRGVRERDGVVAEATPWSPALADAATQGFVAAAGTALKDKDGLGGEVALRGVNLGGYLLTEKWLTGLGGADTPAIEDEWTLRQVLTERFGVAGAEELLGIYRQAYLQEEDFDRLAAIGVNFIRLPIFYRILQDDNGQWIRDSQGNIDFGPIDFVVRACADRGFTVLLDLHGAPGSQSKEFHTGRANFNKLFEQSPEGEMYRDRTVEIWKALAQRYKDNAAVLGYDLLNEPSGAPSPQILWDFYDRLYREIRAIDVRHTIVMEGLWDGLWPPLAEWETLPPPSDRGWTNVVYQFHYYLWGADEDAAAHQVFIDKKIADSKQALYNVPVLIGEFTAFGQRASWQYYLDRFNGQGWGWALWSYKFRQPSSTWGLFLHTDYDEDLPRFRAVEQDGSPGDSFEVLSRKLSKYDTPGHHAPNESLINIVADHTVSPGAAGEALFPSPQQGSAQMSATAATPGAETTFSGANFGDLPGTVWFPWNYCIEIPSDSPLRSCNRGTSSIVSWSDTMIRAMVPMDYSSNGYGSITITPSADSFVPSSYMNQPPVIDALGDQTISEGGALSFAVTGFDPDGDALTWTADPLPRGSVFANQTFSWTPDFDQAGIYTVTFAATDGALIAQRVVRITVTDVKLGILSLSDTPDPFSPNNDGRRDTTTISGKLNHPALWRLEIKNSTNVSVNVFTGSGWNFSQVWDGRDALGARVPDGLYGYTLTAMDAGGSRVARSRSVTLDATAPVVSGLTDSPDPFRPSLGQTTAISFTLSEPAYVTLQIYNKSGKRVRTLLSGSLRPASSNAIVWDGKNGSGAVVAAGVYTYKLWVWDKAQNRASPYPVTGTVTVQ